MTLSSTTTKSSYTQSDSSPYPTGFKFLLNTDVKVIFRDAAGTETTLTESTHYTLTGAGNDAGGTVTVTDVNFQPNESGETLTIKRAAPETQLTDLPLGGAFPSSSVEEAMDRLTMLVQQHSEEIARTIVLSETSAAGPITLPDPEGDKLLGWNSGGTDLVNITNVEATPNIVAIGTLTPVDGNFIVGDGSTWVAESGATARTSLGLGTGDTPEFAGMTLTSGLPIVFEGTTADDFETTLVIADPTGDRTFTFGNVDCNLNQDLSTSSGPTFAGLTLSNDLAFTQANPQLRGGDADGIFYITASTAISLGANMLLYGDTHATQANDMTLRSGTTVNLRYDDSASQFDFQDNALTTTGDVGFGTTNGVASGYGLHVHNPIATEQARIAITNADNGGAATDGLQLVLESGGNAIIEQRENAALQFATNATVVGQFTAAGLFGVGVAAAMELDVGPTNIGSDNSIRVRNDDNTSSASHAILRARTNSATGGDPYAIFEVSGATACSLGLDNSDSDIFKIQNNSSSLSGNSGLNVDTSNNVGIGVGSPDGTLHVHTASAGTVTAATNADDLVVETNVSGGISILTPNNVTGHIMFGDPDDNDVGKISYFHSDNSLRFETNASDSLIIDSTGGVGVGAAASGAKLYVTEDATNLGAIRGYNTSASFASHTLQLYTDTVAGTGFNFVQCASDVDGTVDNEYLLRGDGNAFADGSWSGCGADYAEFFESTDGSKLDVGRTVVLEGNKVRYATLKDDPNDIIGVVRPKVMSGRGPLVRGNSAWNMWAQKYLTNDYGAYIMEDYVVYEWRETWPEQDDGTRPGEIIRSYAEDNIPDGVTVPRNAKKIPMKRRKLNPSWNKSLKYISREDRDEWALIGLLGQMPVEKNENLGLNWIKLREISVTVDEYLVR